MRIRLLSLFLCIVLCSCSAFQEPDPTETLRNASVITAQDGDLLFALRLREDGCVFHFSSPELFKRLTVSFKDGSAIALYDGLECAVEESFVAAILPLYQAFCAFGTETPERIPETVPFYRVSLDGSSFLLYYEVDTGAITRILAQTPTGERQYEILSCLPE